MRNQRTLRDGWSLSLTSAMVASLLLPPGCKQVEDLADKVKGEEAKDDEKSADADKKAEDEKADEKAEDKPKVEVAESKIPPADPENKADPKVDPTPVAEAEVEPVPVEELANGLDLMLTLVPEKAQFAIARDATVFIDYVEQGVKFADGPIGKIKAMDDTAEVKGELRDVIEAFDVVSQFHEKVRPAIETSGVFPKEGMVFAKVGGDEFLVFAADDPMALSKFVAAIAPGEEGDFTHCKGIEGYEGWNVCAEKEPALANYAVREDPAKLKEELAGWIPGVDLEQANILTHFEEEGGINIAVNTMPGSLHLAFAIPSGNADFKQIDDALEPGEAKTLANVSPGAGFLWAHVDPKVLEMGVGLMGGDTPKEAADFVKSMTGDFVFAGSVNPPGVVLQAGVSGAEPWNAVATMADGMKDAVPKELPELGKAQLAFAKSELTGGEAKAQALHLGITGIPEADIMKAYTGLHMDGWAFASESVFTLAVGPSPDSVGKLLETHGTGPSEELLAALPAELADGLRKKEVSMAMHLPMDFLHGKQLHDLIRSALKQVPDAKPDDIIALTSLVAPFSSASMWMAHPDGKAVFHAAVTGVGNTETEEGKIALEAAHAVVDGALPDAEFGPIAVKYEASPMAYAYKARSGIEGPGYMVGSGIGGVAAAALLAVPVSMGQANAALADDLGVKPEDPEPEIVEPEAPKPKKVVKKKAEPPKSRVRPTTFPRPKGKDDDGGGEDDGADDDGGSDPVVEPKNTGRPKPPKPTPDAPKPETPTSRRRPTRGG